METNKEIITQIIDSLDLEFSNHGLAKINREKLIDCWSENRKDHDYKFYGYSTLGNMSESYLKIFKNINKSSCEPWRSYILRTNGYRYCPKCNNLKILADFNTDKDRVASVTSYCKTCNQWSYNNNKEVNNAQKAKQRAAKLSRTPCWLTKEDQQAIKDLYAEAQELEKLTGIKYHVDHEIPLQGLLVSGLHVPNNLQIITATENCSKSTTQQDKMNG